MATQQASRHFAFILAENFSMFCMSAAIDALRVANDKAGRSFYRWTAVSHDGKRVRASNGMSLWPDHSVDDLPPADITFIVASTSIEFPGRAKIIETLRVLGRRGGKLGALSVGSHVLALAGQLEGRRCTIHWENRAAFREAFPDIECTANVYEIDRDRYTSAGATTGIDLMLEIIRADLGADIAEKVASSAQTERVRSHHDRQRIGLEPDLNVKSEKLSRLTALMAENLEEPLTAGELAGEVQLSVRQVERLFLKHLNSTPRRYYMTLRLERARQLLRQTRIPVLDVALSTGFTSQSYFAQCYRLQFGRSPSQERHRQS